MKKLLSALLAVLTALFLSLTAFASEGRITYSGNSGKFIFAPGSEESPSDLFLNFKDVMPGDTITQRITLKNNADGNVAAAFYLKSAAPVEDAEFLSQLRLTVHGSVRGENTWLYDAPSDGSAMDGPAWLGTLHAGGEVDLALTLSVPASLGNDWQDRFGRVDWEFLVEEYPIEADLDQGYWTHGSDVSKIVKDTIPEHSAAEILVDGAAVPRGGYELYSDGEGNLIIKLLPDYLDTLAIGEHLISIRTRDGGTRDVYLLTVLPAGVKSPQTGDDSHIGLWIGLAVASLALAVILSGHFWLPGRKKKTEDDA